MFSGSSYSDIMFCQECTDDEWANITEWWQRHAPDEFEPRTYGDQSEDESEAAPAGAAQEQSDQSEDADKEVDGSENDSDEEVECEWCGSIEEDLFNDNNLTSDPDGIMLCQECIDDNWGWQKHSWPDEFEPNRGGWKVPRKH